MQMLKRIGREWVVLISTIIAAAFMVGDSAGWIEYLFGYKPKQIWIYIAVFIIFAIIVLCRLIKLQSTIDKTRGEIIFNAVPSSMNINSPSKSEPRLANDEFKIYTTIQFEIWTDIDINTASLVLNVVGIRFWRLRKFWELPRRKRVIGIRMEGQDSTIYRKKIKASDEQPFRDRVTFKWRGKRVMSWGNTYELELALKANIPNYTWRTIIDLQLYERGLTRPL